MNALCVYGGSGSMAYAARQVGMKIVGNIEPRNFEKGETFLYNFPDSVFHRDFDKIGHYKDIDLILGHPSCGSFSTLNWRQSQKNVKEIYQFLEIIREISPKYFIMDNLEKSDQEIMKSLKSIDLSDYNLFIQYITNRNYGNAQIRKRFYLIGSKNKEYFPVPNEDLSIRKTVKEVIGDLYGKEGKVENHFDVLLDEYFGLMTNVVKKGKCTYREAKEFFKNYPLNKSATYIKANGSRGTRIGLCRPDGDGFSHVLSGSAKLIHYARLTPYTIRESLRIMGYQDDFVIRGQEPNDQGLVKIKAKFYKKVGKGVCIESIRHFITTIVNHELGIKKEFSSLEEAQSDRKSYLKLQLCKRQNTPKGYCKNCKEKMMCSRRK